MPRPENPGEVAKRERQARYRQRLEDKGRPEASEVDVALAASAAAFADTVKDIPVGKGDFRTVVIAILRGTVDILIKRGCTSEEAIFMVRWRVSRESRRDMGALVAASRMPRRLGLEVTS